MTTSASTRNSTTSADATVFHAHGATATDRGLASAKTANLARPEAEALFGRIRAGRGSAADAALFRAQMLTKMARMSVEDGMVMQIHRGAWRNHGQAVARAFGRDRGFDIPMRTDYVRVLKSLLEAVGMERSPTPILFTLDESAYARELAPLAGGLSLPAPRPRLVVPRQPRGHAALPREDDRDAGFYNTVGFNDDTRAFPSIPARHDVARRVDCAFLARLVGDHRLREAEAFDLARALAYDLPKRAYKFDA